MKRQAGVGEPVESLPTGRREFCGMLKKLDASLPLAKESKLAEADLAGRFFLATRGVPDYLMTLVRSATQEALSQGNERVEMADLARVYEAKLAMQRVLAEQANPFIGKLHKGALDRVQPADELRTAGVGLTPRAAKSRRKPLTAGQQDCTPVTVAFRDEAVADFFDEQVDAGRQPESFGRCWLHTHPGDCPLPSATDEETFDRVFGRAEWAVMFIIARSGETYTRLRFNSGPGGDIELGVTIDYESDFPASDRAAWSQEFADSVHDVATVDAKQRLSDPFGYQDPWEEDWYHEWLQVTEDDSDRPNLRLVHDE